MPIRFRCAYCNQLMAISQRKIGTVVACPKCAGDIIVPSPNEMQPNEMQPIELNQPAPKLNFDDPQFDQFLNASAPSEKAPADGKASALTHQPNFETKSIALPQAAGIFIPLRIGILLILAFILSLIVLFFLGFLTGKFWTPAPQGQ